MQTNQILAAINQPKSKQTTAHAAQLANIYKLLKEIKPDINGIELQDTVLYFGRETETKWLYSGDLRTSRTIINNKGTELPAKQFCITTTYGGSYKFTVPVDNSFFVAVCTLLGINAEFISPVPAAALDVKESIFVEAGVIDAINKAAKFVLKADKSWDRPGLQGVLLEISGGFLTVVGCDAHRLYKSAPFKCNGMDQQIIIKPGLGKLLQPKNSNSIEIQTISGLNEYNKPVISSVSINQTIFETIDAKYPDYAAVIPNYDQFMEFETKEFINQVKKVLPAANKTTNQIVFHLNGSINLKTQDLDFGNEMQSDMRYISKDFKDTDIGFNGKYLLTSLSAFKSDKLRMYSAGNPNRAAIFTEDQQKEIVLLMPVMLNA